MSLTRDEVLKMVEDLGYSTDKRHLEISVAIKLGDDLVGIIRNDSILIAEYIPSVVGKVWYNVPRRTFLYDKMNSFDGVRRALDALKDSTARYEAEMKMEKVEHIKKYFKSMSSKELHQ